MKMPLVSDNRQVGAAGLARPVGVETSKYSVVGVACHCESAAKRTVRGGCQQSREKH